MESSRLLMVFIVYFLILTLCHSFCYSASTKCHTFMTSTCKDNEVTSWNRKHVGKHIKRWIKSIIFEYRRNEQSSGESNCKALIMKEMPFFSNFAPYVISRYGVMVGNISPRSYESYNKIFEGEASPTMSIQFQGPIWADLNNHFEWIVESDQEKITARLSLDSILRNGLYYGILNNNEMKLGVLL